MIPKQCKDSKFRLVTLSSNCVWLVIYSPLSGLQITDLRHTANSQSVLIKLNLKVTPPRISHLKWYDNVPSKHSTNVVVSVEIFNVARLWSGKSCELDDDQIWADIQLPLLISCFIPGYSQEVRSLNTSYHRPTRAAARIKSPAICTLFITLPSISRPYLDPPLIDFEKRSWPTGNTLISITRNTWSQIRG